MTALASNVGQRGPPYTVLERTATGGTSGLPPSQRALGMPREVARSRRISVSVDLLLPPGPLVTSDKLTATTAARPRNPRRYATRGGRPGGRWGGRRGRGRGAAFDGGCRGGAGGDVGGLE